MEIKKIIDFWAEGALTSLEATSHLIRAVGRKKDAGEFSIYVEDALLLQVLEELKKSPWTDVGWSKVKVIGSWCGSYSEDAVKKRDDTVLAESRAGTEVLRADYKITQ